MVGTNAKSSDRPSSPLESRHPLLQRLVCPSQRVVCLSQLLPQRVVRSPQLRHRPPLCLGRRLSLSSLRFDLRPQPVDQRVLLLQCSREYGHDLGVRQPDVALAVDLLDDRGLKTGRRGGC